MLELPASMEFQPGQCIVVVNTGLVYITYSKMLLANIMLVQAPSNAEGRIPHPAIEVDFSQVIMASMPVYGVKASICPTLGCVLFSFHASIAIESARFLPPLPSLKLLSPITPTLDICLQCVEVLCLSCSWITLSS